MPNNIYSINGLNIVKSNLFKISYFDKPKKTFNNTHWINGGFFGKYAEQGKKFTLPVGNVCADISLETLCNPAQFYLKPYVSNNKLKLSCNQNFQSQMKTFL